MLLPKSFYNNPTLKVAQDLLGCFLVRKIDNKIIRAKIMEAEAYDGPRDLASHASRGRTPRTEVMFGEPGMIYIYLVYGMYHMLNIVTGKKDYPAAVLIRAVSAGDKQFCSSRINGPGKLTKFLQINKTFNNLPIYTKKHGLWIEGREEKVLAKQIIKTPRIGVDYAKEYKDKKWRFVLAEQAGSR